MAMLLKLAFRNLLRHRRRSLLTGLTMAGGFFLMSLAVSISEGTYSLIIDRLTRLQTGHVQIHAGEYADKPKLNLTIDQPGALLQVVSAAVAESGPRSGATARVKSGALAFTDEKSSGISLLGVDPAAEESLFRPSARISEGAWLPDQPPANENVAVIGRTASKVLKARPGDEIYLVTQAADGSIANDAFRVAGVIGKEDGAFDRLSVYTHITSAQRFLVLGRRVHEVIAVGEDQEYSDGLRESLNAKLMEIPQNEHKLSVITWKEAEPEFYRSMEADKEGNNITYIIISLLVGIGVLNTVLMATLERTREFGLLKAVGTRPGFIFAMIIAEIQGLALLSIAAGMAAIIPLSIWLREEGFMLPDPIEVGGLTMDRMAGELSLLTLGLPAVIILVTSLFVSVWPALRVAKIQPVKAMRAT